ncbi:hypothetical protein CBS101457_004441 [Exobasidium rhododendri]|nr:hypothetical protein CBS101457_004441 [Exobasidium rhododendri]
MADREPFKREGEYEDHKQYRAAPVQQPHPATSTTDPASPSYHHHHHHHHQQSSHLSRPSSPPPAFYPNFGPSRSHDGRRSYEASPHLQSRRPYNEASAWVGDNQPVLPEYYYPPSERERIATAPFTSIGLPATPTVHRSNASSSASRNTEPNRWGPQRPNSPPRMANASSHAAALAPPPAASTSSSTVNVAIPSKRGSRGEINTPSSYVVESDRPSEIMGASAPISTTPGFGLISISNATPPGGSSKASDRIMLSDQNIVSYDKAPSSSTTTDKGNKPSLEGFSRTKNGWKYRLVVVQNPTRARMCGFGDKDRRPLSPTLIVKLIITDEETGKTISPWKVNTSLFFLASDLCQADDLILSPRNVLVHQHAASIPTAILQQQSPSQDQRHASQASTQSSFFYPTHPINSATTPSPNVALPHLGRLYLGDLSRNVEGGGGMVGASPSQAGDTSHPISSASSSSALTTVTTEHYTRNLVGAAVTSANVLKDEQDNYSIFFVLQDLSVRTEGIYRIRLMFTDLARMTGQTNEGISDALAETYTEPFSVYSPRRFPGMLEPTELSKKLASQGIKIAVRSDKKKRRRDSGQGPNGEVDELEDDEE